jgi:hypothetical protein
MHRIRLLLERAAALTKAHHAVIHVFAEKANGRVDRQSRVGHR